MDVNRYLIYEMLDKQIWFKLPDRLGGGQVRGNVVDVYRNVITNEIEITLSREEKFVFREPDSIVRADENTILFVYGSEDVDTDDDFFEELRKASEQGLGADQVFKSMQKTSVIVSFTVREPKQSGTFESKRSQTQRLRKLEEEQN